MAVAIRVQRPCARGWKYEPRRLRASVSEPQLVAKRSRGPRGPPDDPTQGCWGGAPATSSVSEVSGWRATPGGGPQSPMRAAPRGAGSSFRIRIAERRGAPSMRRRSPTRAVRHVACSSEPREGPKGTRRAGRKPCRARRLTSRVQTHKTKGINNCGNRKM